MVNNGGLISNSPAKFRKAIETMPTRPFIPVPNVLKVELRFTQYGGSKENIIYIQHQDDSSWDIPQMGEAAGVVAQWWKDSMKALTGDSVKLVEVFATDLTTITSATAGVTVTSSNQGGAVDDNSPSNVTFTTTFKSSHRGRSSRGRNYFVGIPASKVSEDTVDDAYATDLLLAYYDLNDALDALDDSAKHVIVSFKSEGEWRDEGLVLTVTSYAHADLDSDSQRKRLKGRGA